jgi:hypothetical protein
LPDPTRTRSVPPESTALADELLEEARRHGRILARDNTERLSIETTVTIADTATALRLRQRQLAAIVRLLRHAVAVRQPE